MVLQHYFAYIGPASILTRGKGGDIRRASELSNTYIFLILVEDQGLVNLSQNTCDFPIANHETSRNQSSLLMAKCFRGVLQQYLHSASCALN